MPEPKAPEAMTAEEYEKLVAKLAAGKEGAKNAIIAVIDSEIAKLKKWGFDYELVPINGATKGKHTCSNCGDPICTRCMVTTAVGQKCPGCAKQSGRAKGNPEPQLLTRAFGAGLVASALGGVLLVAVPFAGLLLALAHGFVVGA